MMHAHGGLLVALVALALGALAGNLLVAVGAVLLKSSRLVRLPAAELRRLAWLGLALPAGLGVLALVVVTAPPLLALRIPALDHCAIDSSAPHICFVHGTLAFSSSWEAAGVALIALPLVAAIFGEGRRLHASRGVLRALVGETGQRVVQVTGDDEPYAFSIGVVTPRIVLSRGLKRCLTHRQLRAAVAHERSHLRSRDALWRVAARLTSFLLAPKLRRRLLALLVLAQEKRADQAAARAVGSAALVAETLLLLGRQSSRQHAAADASALAGGWLEARIEALCLPASRERLDAKLTTAVALLIVPVLLAPVQLHGATESLASLLLSAPVHSHDDADRHHQQTKD